MEKAYLILSDGSVFEGQGFGAAGETVAELRFSSAVVGYMEVLADPEFAGKIAVHTFPLIGNYGAIAEEAGSRPPVAAGVIAREVCDAPSNFRMESTLKEYLTQNNVAGVEGIDTRALKRKQRAAGVLCGMITPDKNDLEEKLKKIRAYAAGRGLKLKPAHYKK